MMTEEETTATSASIDWPASFEMQKARAEKAERALVEVQRMATERADERDAYAAVIADVRGVLTAYPNYGARHAVELALAITPDVALAARDRRVAARAWREGFEAGPDINPYAEAIENGGTP